jgi:hypothetical protein
LPNRLAWTVGPSGAETPVDARAPAPARQGRSPFRGLVLAALYAAALALAALLGYELGRWRHVRAAHVEGLANQLAVEDLAWAEADQSLYSSTLDGAMSEEERSRLEIQFSMAAPPTVRHRLLGVSLQPPDRALVTVGVEGARGPAGDPPWGREEVRAYHLVGRSWLRTDDP